MGNIVKRTTLQIEVEYQVNRTMDEEREIMDVISLCVSPNFHTVEDGAQLQRVKITGPNGEEVEYNSSMAYGVFPIVNGCSTDCVFFGTEESCVEYTKAHKGKGEFIISPINEG